MTIKLPIEKALLFIIFVVFSTSTILWATKDQTPPPWDPADHISASYDYYRYIANLDFRGFAHEFFVEPHYYAPFVHLANALVFLFAGASKVTALVINMISLAAILVSVAWMTRRLYVAPPLKTSGGGPARPADPMDMWVVMMPVLAGLLASSYHFSAWLLHDAFLDYPLMAIVSVSFALLLGSDGFARRRYVVWFGVAAGMGMLTKQTFAFFLALPILYLLLRILRTRNWPALLNVFIGGLVCLGIASIWYVPHLDDVIAIYRVNQEGAVNENEAPLFTLMSNAFYPHSLISSQVQVPFGILFIIGLIYSLVRRRRESILLYLWLLSGIGLFTLVANKDVRYTVPVLPAVAILSVSWISAFARSEKRGVVRGLLLGSGLAISAWAFVSFFNAQWPQDGRGYYINTPRFQWMVFARNYYGFDHRPLPDDWGVPEIVRTVASLPAADSASEAAQTPNDWRQPTPRESVSPQTKDLTSAGDLKPTLGVVVNLPYLNPSSIGTYSRLLSGRRAGPPLIDVDYIVSESSLDRLRECKYLLVRTGLEWADWVAPVERQVEAYIRANPSRFVRIASFPIPLKQAEAVIYRCGE